MYDMNEYLTAIDILQLVGYDILEAGNTLKRRYEYLNPNIELDYFWSSENMFVIDDLDTYRKANKLLDTLDHSVDSIIDDLSYNWKNIIELMDENTVNEIKDSQFPKWKSPGVYACADAGWEIGSEHFEFLRAYCKRHQEKFAEDFQPMRNLFRNSNRPIFNIWIETVNGNGCLV